MKRYMGRRVLQLLPILLGITLLSFLLVHVGNTDMIDVMESNRGAAMSEEQKEALREQLGLNLPLAEQYLLWLKGVVTGDMGTSYVSGKPVAKTFLSKLPATFELMITALLFTIAISIPLGILAAVHKNRFVDYLIRALGFIGNSMPGFVVALLLLYVFALKLGWFPVMGNGEGAKSVILPALTLTAAMASKYTRQVRATVLEEMNKPYVMGARARGIRERRILYVSILKTAMLTILTLLALSIGSLLGGTAIVETIFMWDGVGKLAVDAVTMRDYPMIQAYVIWMAVIYVGINLVTDLLYHVLDPRIRLGREDMRA